MTVRVAQQGALVLWGTRVFRPNNNNVSNGNSVCMMHGWMQRCNDWISPSVATIEGPAPSLGNTMVALICETPTYK